MTSILKLRWLALWWALVLCLGTGAHAQPAGANNALSFDGVDDRVVMASLPTPFQNLAGSDFTVLTWIRPSGTANFRRVLFAQQNNSNFFSIAVNTGNTLYAYVVVNGTTYSVVTSGSIPAGAWSHVAVVWKSSSQSVSIFINGIQAATSSGGSSSTGTDGIMTLGARSDGAQFFPGSLDRLAIYPSALADLQIRQAQCNDYPAGATNSYAFDQGTANGNNAGVTTLTDGGSAPQAGTLQNFALTGTTSNWVDSTAGVPCIVPGSGTPTPVPSLGPWALIGLAGCLAMCAMGGLRTRRR
ncbi:LamG domain-containing protein [Acidovorax sp. FG27]|uniref:LamG domain-containing protein n=1 Tax=Acidovorax sp. FG27 TaxID=3133652 RepID=UPI0030E9B96E